MLIEPVRRRFERNMRNAFVGERRKRRMQRHRIGRRQRAVDRAARLHDSNRPDRRRLWPSAEKICRAKSATDVLPLVPVTATAQCGLLARKASRRSSLMRRADCRPRSTRRPAARSRLYFYRRQSRAGAPRNGVGNERCAIDLGAGKTGKNRTRPDGGTRRGDARNLKSAAPGGNSISAGSTSLSRMTPLFAPMFACLFIRPDA